MTDFDRAILRAPIRMRPPRRGYGFAPRPGLVRAVLIGVPAWVFGGWLVLAVMMGGA